MYLYLDSIGLANDNVSTLKACQHWICFSVCLVCFLCTSISIVSLTRANHCLFRSCADIPQLRAHRGEFLLNWQLDAPQCKAFSHFSFVKHSNLSLESSQSCLSCFSRSYSGCSLLWCSFAASPHCWEKETGDLE